MPGAVVDPQRTNQIPGRLLSSGEVRMARAVQQQSVRAGALAGDGLKAAVGRIGFSPQHEAERSGEVKCQAGHVEVSRTIQSASGIVWAKSRAGRTGHTGLRAGLVSPVRHTAQKPEI